MPLWPELTRRAALGSAMLLAVGCDRIAKGEQVPPSGPLAPLRSVTKMPIGCCFRTEQMGDAALALLLATNFSQITPELEMKMPKLLLSDGSIRFDAADMLVDFARENRMAVHGHTLIWYKHDVPYFQKLQGDSTKFLEAYKGYIQSVVSHFKGKLRGWDVVNEAVDEPGTGLRDCLWGRVLGEDDYMIHAFAAASEADPDAVLFLNDYSLDKLPAKRKTFMALVERLLKKGAKIGGIGTQTHIRNDLPRGQVATAIKELASFGLPLHISELDIGFRLSGGLAANLEAQTAAAREVAETFMGLPAKQRYAFSFWGARDRDSWLMAPPFNDFPGNQPAPFNNDGSAKPMTHAIAGILGKHR